MEMWFSEFHTPDVKHSIRVNRQLFSRQSDYQRIDIFETPEFGRVLTLDGNVMLTERDEFIYDEMITHVPMSVHKEAKDILVIGAGDGGVVRELTRYDRVRHIDLVEMDPMVVEACRAYLPENACRLDDRRVHLHYENALRFIRRCEAKYDLIIVDSSDPFGPSEGLFTREFYGNSYNALKDDGIMVNQQGSPFYTEEVNAFCMEHIFKPTMAAMKAEGRDFVGILFVGLMLTEDGPKVLEYNARFGDPETQVVLPRMKTDLVEMFEACIDGKLAEKHLEFEDNAAVCVVLASDGYPVSYEKGYPITGFEKFHADEGYYCFHAGTKRNEKGIVTNGGRVLGVTAKGTTLKEARANAYKATEWIEFDNKYMRHDIGKAIDEA